VLGAGECDFDAEEIEREEQLARRRAEEEVRTLKPSALLLLYQVVRQLHCEERCVVGGERQQGVSPLQVHLPDPHGGPLCGRVGFFPDRTEADSTAQWSDMGIWKTDLRGAYTLPSFSPNDTPLFAMELSDDLIEAELS
jgi:hypothetical protein